MSPIGKFTKLDATRGLKYKFFLWCGISIAAVIFYCAGRVFATGFSVSSPSSSAGLSYYQNPIVNACAPDPGVLFYNGSYYAVTTGTFNNNSNAFPLRKSDDLISWRQVGWIFPDWIHSKNPQWAEKDFWAPELHIVNGRFVVYYTARNVDGMLCIGVATSNKVTGQFTDIGLPLLQNKSEGVIDPTYFNDSGTPYLIWKVDGNAHGNPTPILAAQLAHTGTTIIGKPTELIRNDETWEGGLVEGPWIVKNGVEYFLFYSAGGGFKSTNYSVWVAKASKLLGPYQKNPHAILHTKLPEDGHSWKGPGHCSVLPLFGSTDRGYVIFYHAWVHGKILPFRVMLMDALTWQDGWPRVVGGVPSETREPVLA